jgi:hypothetical protein
MYCTRQRQATANLSCEMMGTNEPRNYGGLTKGGRCRNELTTASLIGLWSVSDIEGEGASRKMKQISIILVIPAPASTTPNTV